MDYRNIEEVTKLKGWEIYRQDFGVNGTITSIQYHALKNGQYITGDMNHIVESINLGLPTVSVPNDIKSLINKNN